MDYLYYAKYIYSFFWFYTCNYGTTLLGDFNGHAGYKRPQNINQNGKIILELTEKYDLFMLNYDQECRGEITYERGPREV